jgi:hypothetical protein
MTTTSLNLFLFLLFYITLFFGSSLLLGVSVWFGLCAMYFLRHNVNLHGCCIYPRSFGLLVLGCCATKRVRNEQIE